MLAERGALSGPPTSGTSRFLSSPFDLLPSLSVDQAPNSTPSLLPVPSAPEHSTPTQTLAAAPSSPGDLREAGFGSSRRSNSDPSGGGLGPPAQQVCGAGFGIGAMSWAGPDEILLSTSLAGFLDSELLRSPGCGVPELAWLLILALVSCD